MTEPYIIEALTNSCESYQRKIAELESQIATLTRERDETHQRLVNDELLVAVTRERDEARTLLKALSDDRERIADGLDLARQQLAEANAAEKEWERKAEYAAENYRRRNKEAQEAESTNARLQEQLAALTEQLAKSGEQRIDLMDRLRIETLKEQLAASESHARALGEKLAKLERELGLKADGHRENERDPLAVQVEINAELVESNRALASRLEGAEAACNQAQARFATLWTFLQWVRTRNWTLQQLDDKARDLNDEGPYEIGVNVAAELSTLRAERERLTKRVAELELPETPAMGRDWSEEDKQMCRCDHEKWRHIYGERCGFCECDDFALLTPPAASNESEPK